MDRLELLSKHGFETGRANARVLVDKLVDSCDLMEESFSPETFAELLTGKFDECTVEFTKAVKDQGVFSPIAIVDEKAGWVIADGHHRLAVAFYYDIDIPYVLIDHEDDTLELYDIFGLDETTCHDIEST